MVGDELQAPYADGIASGKFYIGQVVADGDDGMFWSESLEESMLQMPLPGVATVGVFCAIK
jgi:hypothetical protein